MIASTDQHHSANAYPLADAIPQERLDREAALLDAVSKMPLLLRLPTYLRMGGPGFMNAALTLGAGTMTAAMLSGAQFGYRTLWIAWLAIGSGLFMMAGMARITTRGNFRIIQEQSRRHGWFVARVLTAIVGVVLVSVVFNFGQVALGTHLIESLAETSGVSFPQAYNWPLYCLVTVWIALNYGRRSGKGVALVERFMKLGVALMLACFALCLLVVGVDWRAALQGLFVPWLPGGKGGIDLFVASAAAAIGPMNWVFFHYAGLAKGWGPRHEGLARLDTVVGMGVPYVLVVVIVTGVFAGTLHGFGGGLPTSATELSRALVPLLGDTVAKFAFLLGFLAVPITTTVGMSIACAVMIHEAFDWQPDVRSPRWVASLLLPQIGLFAAFAPNPLLLIVAVAAALSLTSNLVGWSFFLMLNDKAVLGENRIGSRGWNLGILIQITLLNCVAIVWVFNRMGLWG